jgi:hypothetical protein
MQQAAHLRDQKIRELIGRHRLPAGVHGFDIRYGKDAAGDPAMWVRFEIDDEPDPAQEKVAALNDLRRAVQSQLLALDLEYWPYVEFRSAPAR